MTFDELPLKTTAYFLGKVIDSVNAINYFNRCNSGYCNVIQAIKLTMKIYASKWADRNDIILPKEIIEELFPYIFGEKE